MPACYRDIPVSANVLSATVTPPNLKTIKSTFAAPVRKPSAVDPSQKCAAVAIIFRTAPRRQPPDNLELCFVRRAPFPGDPWSGDMAFPGGKGESGDRSFHDIAVRETREETGLVVTQEHYIGALPRFDVQPGSRVRRLLLKPMIYFTAQNTQTFSLSQEIAQAYWIPVPNLWDPRRLTTVDWGRLPQDYPGIRHEDEVIWGLTYRILGDLAERLSHPLPSV